MEGIAATKVLKLAFEAAIRSAYRHGVGLDPRGNDNTDHELGNAAFAGLRCARGEQGLPPLLDQLLCIGRIAPKYQKTINPESEFVDVAVSRPCRLHWPRQQSYF